MDPDRTTTMGDGESLAMHQSGRQLGIGLYVTAIHTANETAFCVFIRAAGLASSERGI